jgi:transposase-like protein
MPRNRKTKSYPAEFRAKAVRLATEGGYTVEQVANQHGCSAESVRRWKENAKGKLDPETAARMEREESESKRLKKENVQLKMENDFLKKAAAYFAKESQYAMADNMRTEFVVEALKMAIGRGRKLTGDIWLHSDRGVQFSSSMFRDILDLVGIEQSMSRKGDCYDNAPRESWFGKLKVECIYPHGEYKTRAESELSIIEYIEMFYNSKRLHGGTERRGRKCRKANGSSPVCLQRIASLPV